MTVDRLLAAKKKFSRLLKEIFQFDCADLDFGIYRILAMRRAELERFLDDELLPQVEGILATAAGDRSSVQSELSKLEGALRDAGIHDFSSSPKWDELKGKLAESPDVAVLAREVFSDLTTFFARYYDEGDFMALPRYKGDTYAVPYDGSEVKLHWANADQHYIKTTEQHADYTAVIDGVSGLDKPRLRFRLAAAESDRDNNKSTEKRRYLLRGESPLEVDDNQLTLWFEYRVPEPGNGRQPTQNAICEETEKAVLAAVPQEWQAALARKATQNPEKYTVLGYQLYRYTKKNTSDYFIHKDLGGFLRRELDFFLKNEVLFLDDIEGRTTTEINAALQKVKAVRAVGGKIIDWLNQLESFQRRLYMKRKFVLESRWCVAARHIPDQLRPEVCRNPDQIAEWATVYGLKKLLGAQDVSPGFLDDHPTLMVDTRYFPAVFRLQLVTAMADAETLMDGLLINGDNAHALRLLSTRYQGDVECVYMDPPYNTEADRNTGRFLYKDSYARSSWLSLIGSRILALSPLLSARSVFFCSIDENEVHRLSELVYGLIPDRIGLFTWIKKRKGSHLSRTIRDMTEFVVAASPRKANVELFGEEAYSDKAQPLAKRTNKSKELCFPAGVVVTTLPDKEYAPGHYGTGTSALNFLEPFRVQGGIVRSGIRVDGPFVWSQEMLNSELALGSQPMLSKKFGFNVLRAGQDDRVKRPSTLLDKTCHVGTNEDANEELIALFGREGVASYPKPVSLLTYLIRSILRDEDGIVLDPFAGSGTTGHAVVTLNRQDGGRRSFILIEMGEYFEDVLVARLKKVCFAPKWEGGNPDPIQDSEEIERGPRAYKVLRLESYDDALENIEMQRDPVVDTLFRTNPGAVEDYTLRYMLKLEAEDSLLDLERFRKPWNYTIKIRRDGVIQDSPVDLVETFNYLLGLRIKRYDTYGQEGLLFVIGTDPEGRRVIVVWRDCDLWPNDRLEEKCRQAFESFRPDDFDIVYVNGDNHLPIMKTGKESWKVSLIEETFHARMFDTTDVE